jgi:LL-diaminopimelate aminotransferase
VVGTLNGLGWSLKPPLGSCYVWAPVPEGDTSASFADRLLDTTGVFVAPGSGYGGLGEGFVRSRSPSPTTGSPRRWIRIARALA